MTNYNKYGEVAVNSVKHGNNPASVSDDEVEKVYFTKSSREKGCPKNAFLGLCEDGLVKGIKGGVYLTNSESNLNKQYALTAVKILTDNHPTLGRKELWSKVKEELNIDKSHNSQMDVVIALFENKMIIL